MPNLNNWELKVSPTGMFGPPESGLLHFQGLVYGDPVFMDGESITVSNLIAYDPQEAAFLTQEGVWYRLKEPNKTYEDRFPNALSRIMKHAEARKVPVLLLSERHKWETATEPV